MFISEDLRKNNIAEYLLYMWQVEDLIRANAFDADALYDHVIKGCGRSIRDQHLWKEWYQNLIDMMISEEKKEHGHLQINENVLVTLTDLHTKLLNSSKYDDYRESFYKSLPFIVEFRTKSGNIGNNEVRDCFELLYGVWMLKLQKKMISDSTEQAVKSISTFVSALSMYYKREKAGELKLDED